MSQMQKPDIRLTKWMILRLKPDGHFILAGDAGNAIASRPRVSSRLVSFHSASMSGTTERGRRYFLVGEGGNGLRLHTAGLLNEWLLVHGYNLDDVRPATPDEADAAFTLTDEDDQVIVDWVILRLPDGTHAISGKSVTKLGSDSVTLLDVREFGAESLSGSAGGRPDSRFRLHGLGKDLFDFSKVPPTWGSGGGKAEEVEIVSPPRNWPLRFRQGGPKP